MSEHDTLPPGVYELQPLEPLLTEKRFIELMQQLVGDRLTEMHETVKGLNTMVQDHEQRIKALEVLLKNVLIR